MSLLNKRQHKNFWNKVDKSGICWEWTGARTSKIKGGYGRFKLNGKLKLAHRITYQIKYGDIPEGFELDHRCRNRCCCNPDHLEAVTHKVNIQRGLTGNYNKIKTHCPRNHEYTPDNLKKTKDGSRDCKTCHRDREYARRLKRKALAAGTMSVMGVDVSN